MSRKNGTNNVLGITLTNSCIVVILARNVVKVIWNQTNNKSPPHLISVTTYELNDRHVLKRKKIRPEYQPTTVQMSELKAVLEMTTTCLQAERHRRHWRTAAAMMEWSNLAHSVLIGCLRSSRSVMRVFTPFLAGCSTCCSQPDLNLENLETTITAKWTLAFLSCRLIFRSFSCICQL